jgi:polysaccharide biosynthesis protein PslG
MSASDYADAVRPALEGMNRMELPARLVLPVGVYLGEPGWLDTLYDRIPDLNELIYGFALHPYGVGEHPAARVPGGSLGQIAELRRAMDRHGAAEKPILVTEYGQSTSACGDGCVSEDEQAEHVGALVDGVAARPEWKVELIVIYQLRDRGTDSPDREEQFGLLREDGSPKPAYPVVRELMERYR